MRLQRDHSGWMATMTMIVAALHLFATLPKPVELSFLVVAIVVLGLPHGALDHLTGRAVFRPRHPRFWFIPFGLLYLGLAALVVGGWLLAPTASLVAFLVIAAGHFGAGDVSTPLALGAGSQFAGAGVAVEALSRGAVMVVALVHAHPRDTSELFAHLIPASTNEVHSLVMAVAPPVATINAALLAIVIAHHLGGWAMGLADHGLVAFEIVALLALFYTTPPLIAFVVYFCFWHSIRHSIRLAARLDASSARAGLRAFIRHAWPMTLGAVAIGLGSYALLRDRTSVHAVLQVVFVGLSALTLPHIVLSWLEGSARNRQKHARGFAPAMDD